MVLLYALFRNTIQVMSNDESYRKSSLCSIGAIFIVVLLMISRWESVELACCCGAYAGEEAVRRLFACKGKDPYRCFLL